MRGGNGGLIEEVAQRAVWERRRRDGVRRRLGGGVLGGRRPRDHKLAPQGERGQGEGGSNRRKEAQASGSPRG
jgi:hypothetical protein